MSRLALIVPARNAAASLGRLFDSVDAQTRPFDEILLYDDASSDATGAMASARGARVVRSDVNTGPSHGKNVLAHMTNCEWIHFHDADDALHPEFVSVSAGWIARDTADVVLFATEDRDDVTGRPLAVRHWDDAELQADAVRYAIVHTITNCGLYRRERFLAAGGFDTSESSRFNEDQAMHLALALAGAKFRADSFCGVWLYQRAGSMSSGSRVACARAQVDVLESVASRTGGRYAREIGARLWRLAGVCAGYADWTYVERSLAICEALGYRDPAEEHRVMRVLARVDAMTAVRFREWLIRSFKPHLRVGLPQADDSRATRSGVGSRP